MKKLWGFFLITIFCSFSTAQTVEFRVDLKVQAYKGLFNPSTDDITIVGNFNNWINGADILTDLDGDTIYTITKTFTANDTLLFKFVKGWDDWEYGPYRVYIVPPWNTVYADYFNRDSIYFPPTPVELKFAVDMGVQAYRGLFKPSSDSVKIAGNFNGWNNGADILTDLDGDTIYTITKTFTSSETLYFRFIMGSNGWEQDPNRVYIVPPWDTVYADYFNRDSSYFTPTPVQFKFEVDMEAEIYAGRFNPATDTLTLRGSFNGWSSNWIMTPNADDPDIYEHNNTLNTYPGDQIFYKYAYIKTDGVHWETDPNRDYTVTSDDITNGSAYLWGSNFNLCCPPSLQFPFDIKFTINMNGAVSAINQQPFTSLNDVRIGRLFWDCGSDCFPSSGWPDEDSLKTTKLFDDGTNGDLVAGDNIWSKDIHFPQWYPAKIEYMYSANWGLPTNNGGNQNESILRKHRIHFPWNISSAAVVDTFGNMGEHPLTNLVIVDIETETPSIINSYSLEQNYPNPFNPSTKIKYTIPQ